MNGRSDRWAAENNMIVNNGLLAALAQIAAVAGKTHIIQVVRREAAIETSTPKK